MLLIGNGKLITRNSQHPYYESGAVIVEGSEIIEAGDFETLKQKYPKADFVDAEKKVIMPGLINAHSHIYSAFARGLQMPGKVPAHFLEILKQMWWRMDNELTLEDVYYSALFTYIESIKNGVTTLIDHHASYKAVRGSLSEIEKAARQLGMRTCLCYEISDRNGREKMQQAVEENMAFIEHAEKESSDMLKGLVGLHAAFTLSDETLDFIKKENRSHAGYHIHVAEGVYDETFCEAHYGRSVVRRLYEHGILGEKTLAGHCIHISEADRQLLKQTKTSIIHNPSSNMNNAVGCLDLLKLIDEHLLVGLGTDGYTNDMLESLKACNVLQKHSHQSADRGFNEAVCCLFENNSRLAEKFFMKPIGRLEKGAKADLILMDYKPYTPMTADNFNSHVMFGMQGSMTDAAMINGKWVMFHRKLQQIDEETVRKACIRQAALFWQHF